MTDEARLARLTELARRVWPEATVVACGDYWEIRHRHSSMQGDDAWYQCVWTSPRKPERAADALEAALLVLADEARIPLTADQVTRDALKSCARDREALTARIREERAAMVKLAEEWEAKADKLARAGVHSAGIQVMDGCARELRERVKRCE